MNKKLLVTILSGLFLFCALGFLGLGANIAANAEDENINTSLYTNYNAPMLLTIVAEKNSSNVGNFDGNFEQSFETGTKIYIYVTDAFIATNEYVSFDPDNGVYLSGNPLSKVSGEDYYLVEISSETEFYEIEIVFALQEFNLNAEYFEYNREISGSLDTPFIKYYKLNKYGGEEEISKIKYSETLIVKPTETITFNSGQAAYSLQSLYFYMVDEYGDMKVANDYPDYKMPIDNYFLENYVFYNSTEIKFAASYSRDNILSVIFNNDNYIDEYKIFEINNNVPTVVSESKLYKDGDIIQVSITLKPYATLTKNSENMYVIEDFNYTSDHVTVDGNNVTIKFTITRDKHIVVYLELTEFEVDRTGSKLGDAEVTFDKNTFVYGDILTVYSSVKGNNEIKSWKIADVEVPKKINETKNGIKRIDGTTIEIDTAVWYGLHQNDFRTQIITGVKTSIIIAIAIPLGAAVLVLAILLFLIISHKRTKNKIKALLEAEKKTGYTYNTGSMIEDLREGKDINVSKEDVKTAMKKKKNKR